jgi:hypothetical protein
VKFSDGMRLKMFSGTTSKKVKSYCTPRPPLSTTPPSPVLAVSFGVATSSPTTGLTALRLVPAPGGRWCASTDAVR